MPRLYSHMRWSGTLFHFGYFLPYIFFFSFSLFNPLLNLLDTLSSLGVAGFELSLNAINFPPVRHFCLNLSNPRSLWQWIWKISSPTYVWWYSHDLHTLLCSNLVALTDTQNIVTPDTTLKAPYWDWLHCAPPRRAFTKTSRWTTRLEAKVKLSIKGGERKGRQTLVISRSFHCAGVTPTQGVQVTHTLNPRIRAANQPTSN